MTCDKNCQCLVGCAEQQAQKIKYIINEGTVEDLHQYLRTITTRAWSEGYTAGACL